MIFFFFLRKSTQEFRSKLSTKQSPWGTVNRYRGALGSPGPFSVLFSESVVLLFGPPIAYVAISKTWQSACREKRLVSVTE